MSNPSEPQPSTPAGLDPGPGAGQTPITTASAQPSNALIYNSSLGIVVLAPVIALLPPRKMDLYTFGLGVAWFFSAGVVVEARTGRGLLWHLGRGVRGGDVGDAVGGGEMDADAQRRQREKRGFLKRIWMGNESDDWVRRRMQREQEALEDGTGYGGLIVEQVREVWGRKGADGEEEVSEGKREYDGEGKEGGSGKGE